MLAFKYSWNKENIEACQTIHQFVDAQVARALRDTEKDKGDKYIILDEMAKRIRDPLELRSQIMGIFVPAKDTPAVTLSNCLFELACQPYRWSQLRRLALTADEPLSFRQLRSPAFAELRFVVFETLRHIGPGAMVQRFAKRNCILPRGGGPEQDQPMFVAKGTRIYLNNSAWHRDPGIWGQDSDQFRPERWKDRKIGEWEWIPFITGHRRCPAADLTLIHTTYMLTRLLQRYIGIKNHDPEERYIEQWDMTHRSRNGVLISFT